MKLKEYQKAMDAAGAPHDAMKKALETVHTAEIKDKVISFEENKKPMNFRWISAVAATLVLAVAFTAVVVIRGDSPKVADNADHSFIIKAGAAEVNPDYYVEIGEMKQDGASWEAEWDSDETNYDYLHYNKLSATVAYTIDNLKCSGENVDYFTYTVHGGYFIMDGVTGEVLQAYSSPDANHRMDLRLIADENDNGRFHLTDEEYNTFIAFGYSDDTGKYREQMEGDQGIDEDGNRYIRPRYDEVYRDMFNENAEGRYLLITAHYEDGTTLSKKIVFELQKKDTADEGDFIPRYILTAKIAE